MKPIYKIDISNAGPLNSEAEGALSKITPEACFHHAMGLRLPLGIYNVSVQRIIEKVVGFCGRLEAYMKVSSKIDVLEGQATLRSELIDYVELAIYAAAEHVDDIDSIAKGFFRVSRDCEKSPGYRELCKEVKRLKRIVSISANAIKHQQARIRLFSIEMLHANQDVCLHGYFVEAVESGVVQPSRVLHREQDCFSLTSLAWEIITFLLGCSAALVRFLESIGQAVPRPANSSSSLFRNTIVAAARLPLYTFGEEHPFQRAAMQISASDGTFEPLNSGLYGSILTRWDKSAVPVFGKFQSSFVGDGVSTSFRFAQPKTISLSHWS